jgi:hypothetical protein
MRGGKMSGGRLSGGWISGRSRNGGHWVRWRYAMRILVSAMMLNLVISCLVWLDVVFIIFPLDEWTDLCRVLLGNDMRRTNESSLCKF